MVISEDKIADAFVHSWQIRLALWYIYHFVVLSHLKKRKGKGEGENDSKIRELGELYESCLVGPMAGPWVPVRTCPWVRFMEM